MSRRAREDGSLEWPAQVDGWVLVWLVLACVALGWATVAVWRDPGAHDARVPVLAVNLAILGALWGLTVPTRYVLTLDALEVHAGLLRQRVRWADLVRLELSWSLLSSTTAAWTARRVVLTTARGRVVVVGPADRIGFVAEVLARAPQLVEDQNPGRGRAWHDPARDRRRRWLRRV